MRGFIGAYGWSGKRNKKKSGGNTLRCGCSLYLIMKTYEYTTSEL